MKRVLFPLRPVGVITSEGKLREPWDLIVAYEYKFYFL